MYQMLLLHLRRSKIFKEFATAASRCYQLSETFIKLPLLRYHQNSGENAKTFRFPEHRYDVAQYRGGAPQNRALDAKQRADTTLCAGVGAPKF